MFCVWLFPRVCECCWEYPLVDPHTDTVGSLVLLRTYCSILRKECVDNLRLSALALAPLRHSITGLLACVRDTDRHLGRRLVLLVDGL